MNFNRNQTKFIGILLIALGMFAIFRLWWLLPALLLGGAGVYIYQRQHKAGRMGEAVQGGLWGLGLALLYLIDFIFPGVLLLGGASLLLRGHEQNADVRVQNAITRVRNFRAKAAVNTSAPASTNVSIVEEEKPATGETVRL